MSVQYKTTVDWDAAMADVEFVDNSVVSTAGIGGLAISGIKITSGAPAATANQWLPGAIVQNIVTGILYSNTGSTASPVWTIIENATGSSPIAIDITRTTAETGSFQDVAGDLTYQGNAGGTGSFHAGMMGHFHGTALTNATAYAYHAGVIGGYSVLTSDAVGGPKAGVVGFIGADGPTTIAANAVMAVLEGDGGVVTANAAYGVQYLNSTPGSHFNYGVDLAHVAGSFAAVSYGIADVRLANDTLIIDGIAATRADVRAQVGDSVPVGSIYVSSAPSPGTTKPNVFIKVLNAAANTDWERIVTAATD